MPCSFIKLHQVVKDNNMYKISDNPDDLWILLQSIMLYLKNHCDVLDKNCIEQYIGLFLTGIIHKGVNIHEANVVTDYYLHLSDDIHFKKEMYLYDSFRYRFDKVNCKVADGLLALWEMSLDSSFYQICMECLKTV